MEQLNLALISGSDHLNDLVKRYPIPKQAQKEVPDLTITTDLTTTKGILNWAYKSVASSIYSPRPKEFGEVATYLAECVRVRILIDKWRREKESQ